MLQLLWSRTWYGEKPNRTPVSGSEPLFSHSLAFSSRAGQIPNSDWPRSSIVTLEEPPDSPQPPSSDRSPAVRAHLQLILDSPEFAAAHRQQSFLRFIVEEALAGRGHEIKETVVASVVYGKPADYDPRIDSTVRVEASKLRQRLLRYYEGSGAAELLRITIPKGSYQPHFEAAALAPAPHVHPNPLPWKIAFLCAASCIAAAFVWYFLIRADTPTIDPSSMKLAQLTERGSYSEAPSISDAADFVVYASDRDGASALNLWRQPLAGGPPTRLTRSTLNHDMPVLSPDASTLVFRAGGQIGSLYRMPAAGGEPILIKDTSGARNPNFRPDGSALAFWIPLDPQTHDYGRLFLRSLEDSQPGPGVVRLMGDFAHAAFPIWHNSGSHLLALGTWQSDTPDKEFDAWVLAIEGSHANGAPVKTGLFPALKASNMYSTFTQRSQIEVSEWRDGWLYFTLPVGDAQDLFRIRLSPSNGRISGAPQRLTFGVDRVVAPRIDAHGRIVFARSGIIYDLFSLQAPSTRLPAQELRRHTSESGVNQRPAIAPSGAAGVWEQRRNGSDNELWFFDLLSGARQKLGWPGDRVYTHGLISPDGRFAAYRISEPGYQPIFRQPVTGGDATRICQNCGTPSDWTSDGRYMLYITGGNPAIVGLLDISSGASGDWIKHPSYNLYGARARLTPAGDGWVALYADNGPRTRQIFLVPIARFVPASQEDWIPLTDGARWDQSPAFSPDGRRVYFVNRHDGFACIMARNIDPATARPDGPAWTVRHFHSPTQTLVRSLSNRGADALWAAGDRLFFTLDQRSSDIWSMSQSSR